MSALSIVASSHYLHAVAEGAALPSLDERLNAVARERFRRIDRFTALAVMGSAECAANQSLDEDCGLYLGSGVGPVGSNTQVQEQLCRDHLPPKPFHFVNTLGSAAGHYVARNLGLRGQNLFISRRGDAFQAALLVACADLELGVVSQALVGTVEECTLPLADHRRRQALPSDVALAEGTHWMLLRSAASAGDAVPLTIQRLASDAAFARHVQARVGPGIAWSIAHAVDGARKRAWSESSDLAPRYDPKLAFHDSRDAAVMTRWLRDRETSRLGLVGSSGRAGVLYLELGAQSPPDSSRSTRTRGGAQRG